MRRLWTPRWILGHAVVVVLVVGFLLLGWWQVGRAAGGNPLSFGYAVEWPVFAGFVIYAWVKEMRRAVRQQADAYDQPTPGGTTSGETTSGELTSGRAATTPAAPLPPAPAGSRTTVGRQARSGPAYDDTGDEELAAYNRYLAWLNAHPHASPSEYPG